MSHIFPPPRPRALGRFGAAAVGIGLLCLMSGCFTGVESTPRIGPRRAAADAAPSREMLMARSIEGEPLEQWRPGKRLRVTDERAALAFSLPSASALVGTDITFEGAAPARSLTGEELTELRFTTVAGDTIAYRTRPAGRAQVPFTAELSVAAAADSMLRGQRLFVLTPMWYDARGRSTVADGLRHVAVRVDSVVPGTDLFPALVVFTPEAEGAAQRAVYLSPAGGTRPFDALFSLTDPRDRYPAIPDATWALIVRSRVAEGMSRDECRLAWGAPSVIRQLPTTAGMVEQWSYPDGRYLIFEDALLSRYRQ